ncbi:MAG: S66 peptidase family protein [Anaerofustis sp.]
MQKLIHPNLLKQGDTVATVSLSWGGAGDADLIWRYQQGVRRLQEVFGLHVVEMKHTLDGTDSLYRNPKDRADDLTNAFSDPSVKAIFSCIGGEDSIRMLPFIDYDVIRNNPKIFLGYSDSTVTHFICMKAGVGSFYGPSILAEFAENVEMHEYTRDSVYKSLFATDPPGVVEPSELWTGEYLPWEESKKHVQRVMKTNLGAKCISGTGTVEGHLIGGCMDVMEMIKNTEIWPDDSVWDGAILFFETSEEMPLPARLRYWLRNYAASGILHRVSGLLWGKPYQLKYYDEYRQEILKVLAEYDLANLPVLYGLDFGHTSPMFTISYGAWAKIVCEENRLEILSCGVK